MSLHTDWTDAKKDSKTKYKLAVKAKRDALEKDIKAGDKAAKAKVLDKNLKDLGIDNDEDVDAYFKFKEDFGPSLDKFEKAKAANTAISNAIHQITQIGQILGNAKLLKAFVPFAQRVAIDKKVTEVADSYKRQIEAKAANWKGINPDFRKPLLDVIATVKAAL
jgi:uncharacterized protein YjgD (DUF1641 family)